MDLQLKNRFALVTGGSKGIGASIVRHLAREGVKVVFCARPSEAMASLEAQVRAEGGSCEAMSVDVFDPIAVANVVEAAAALWGGLDILVNNVGGALRFGSFADLADDDWMRSYEFNVMPVVRFTRAALPHLRRSTLRRIINVSSISALQPGSYNPHYAATKAAVVNLSKHLANVLAKENILVNAVCPGPVHSESWQENIRQNARNRGLPRGRGRRSIRTGRIRQNPSWSGGRRRSHRKCGLVARLTRFCLDHRLLHPRQRRKNGGRPLIC